jgi:hypothetical protein
MTHTISRKSGPTGKNQLKDEDYARVESQQTSPSNKKLIFKNLVSETKLWNYISSLGHWKPFFYMFLSDTLTVRKQCITADEQSPGNY